uniref:Centromere protein T n=1 Tax=Nothoprocta perdicaria TaxID=30464 RepID=A0A8C6Z954_NOTPE
GTWPRGLRAPRRGRARSPRRRGPGPRVLPSEAVALAGAGAGGESNFGRSILLKQRPAILPDLDNGTPRFMLKRIIQTQAKVSPLALEVSKHEETEESALEPPSKRISNTMEMQLPGFVPEDTSVPAFQMTRKKKKFSISEFEREADKRLPQNQSKAHLYLPSSSPLFYRSLRMSLGSLIPPDTVEKRGLLRRPKKRKAIDVEAFEGGVEQNMLQRKAQNYLVDSSAASMTRGTVLTSDAEIVLSNTELFVQAGEENPHRPSTLEPQLPDSKISAQNSKTVDAVPEEAKLVGLESSVATDGGRTHRYSEKNLIIDYESVDRMTPVSPKTSVSQGDGHQGHSHQSELVELFSVPEEVVAGGEHAKAGYSQQSEKKLTKKRESQVTKAQEAGVEIEMITSEAAEGNIEHLDSPKAGENKAMRCSQPSGKAGWSFLAALAAVDISMKTPAFIRAAAYKPLSLPSTPPPAESDTPKIIPLQPLWAKPVPKKSGASQRKKREPELASSLIKKIFSHYVKMPVTREAFGIVQKCCERYFKQLSNDLEAYSQHAGRKTVEVADLELLMRRQGLVTDKMPLHVLIERHLPLEYRKLLIPVAVSGNKIIPCK